MTSSTNEPDDSPIPKGKKRGGKVIKAKGSHSKGRLDKVARGGAPKKFIQSMHLKKGAMTDVAKREGVSNAVYEQEHKNDSGKAGKRARLALTFKKMGKD